MTRSDEMWHWLRWGERGLSSEAIAYQLTGDPVPNGVHRGADHPHDPSDWRRCELLLEEVPSLRKDFHHMAKVSPTWAALVDRWGEIHATYLDEAGGTVRNPERSRIPRTYALIRSVIDGAN